MTEPAEHNFTPLRRTPAYQLVYDAIEGDILSGRLDDGSTLPTEGALAEQFDVHRSTVREGLRLLEQQGLVRRGAAKRMVVAAPETGETAARASKGLALNGVTFEEVWTALALFQPEAARFACAHMKPETLQRLTAVNNALAARQSSEDTINAAFDFFQEIAAASNNRVINVQLQSLNILIRSSLAKVINELPKAASRIELAQVRIIEAFEAGDAAAAARWMRRHVDDLRRGYDVAGVPMDSRVA
ncbi:MAG: GntR family transcriptional regulator [Pseudomonadota bacterium]